MTTGSRQMAPLPPHEAAEPWSERLAGIQSIRRAMALQVAGLSYTTIATVMILYHGDRRSPDTWRTHLRTHGADPRHHASGQRRVPPQHRPAPEGQ